MQEAEPPSSSRSEQGGPSSEHEEDLLVSESPATPSSMSASEAGVARSQMDQLPGIDELAEVPDAELAAVMRKLLTDRKGSKS